ncbi:MAG: hypothetical protein ACE5GQ_06560 [Nitrospinales bacterium]
MSPFKYFIGRALQFLGFITMTWVVVRFFTEESMTPLLYMSLLGMIEFYGGTLLLDKNDGG